MWKLCISCTHMSGLWQAEGAPESCHGPHHLLINRIRMRNHPVRCKVPETAFCLFPQQKRMNNSVKTCRFPSCFYHHRWDFANEDSVCIDLISTGHLLYSPDCSYKADTVKVTADSSVWALAPRHQQPGQQTQVMHQQTIVPLPAWGHLNCIC